MKRRANEEQKSSSKKQKLELPEQGQLSNEQYAAVVDVFEGRHVFITGPAGTGKSFLLKYIIQALRRYDFEVAVTASTGIAAENLGNEATTLHAFIGAGLCNSTLFEDVKRAARNRNARARWEVTEVLIIDEISMVTPHLFVKLDAIGRRMKDSHLPFGGVQLICCGDWGQLQPVITKGEVLPDHLRDMTYCFETDTWKSSIRNIHFLQINFRQKEDVAFYHILQQIRNGKLDEGGEGILRTRIRIAKSPKDRREYTQLYPMRYQVQAENDRQLNELPGEMVEFKWKTKSHYQYTRDPRLETEIKKSVPVEESIKLKVGALVVFLVNLNPECGLVNGLQGKVDKFEDGLPVVEFVNGRRLTIAKYTWRMYKNEKMKTYVFGKERAQEFVLLNQLPIKLAFALTIHKSQSMTLKKVSANVGPKIFAPGQVYTALSRCQSLEGLNLIEFDPSAIKADPKVVSYYEGLAFCKWGLTLLKEIQKVNASKN